MSRVAIEVPLYRPGGFRSKDINNSEAPGAIDREVQPLFDVFDVQEQI